jgi:hypothetical protein
VLLHWKLLLLVYIFSSVSFFSSFSDRIIRASFSDTISLNSSSSAGMFSTGVLYHNDSANFLDSIPTMKSSGVNGSGNRNNQFDTTSLRSQDDTSR